MLCTYAFGFKHCRASYSTRQALTVSDVLEMDKCGIAGDIGSINGRLRVRNVFGGDMAKVGAWPWHAVVSELRNTIRSVSRILFIKKLRSPLLLITAILINIKQEPFLS